jgi:oligopeptide/dipeptide ABC transporter ATP-binding protein
MAASIFADRDVLPNPQPAEAAAPMLKVEGLRTLFRYRGKDVTVVNNVSFDIRAGETVALVGESGSGKSVTALSVMRLVASPKGRTVAGRVLLEDRDLLQLTPAEMRRVRCRTLAMVFQEPMTSLNPILTIGRQLTEGMQLHLGLTASQAFSRGVELLEKVGIPDPKGRMKAYPHQLSGGMRQRVMIAIALSCGPRLLIADEPTTALDVTTQAQILDLMMEQLAELGTSMLLITHDLGLVARYADRVNVMYAGRVVEQGPAQVILVNPRHPYTRGLLKSVPRLDRPREAKLPAIEGMPPNPMELPQGCPFQPRCAYAVAKCRETQILSPVEPSHHVACWRAGELPSFEAEMAR